MEEVSGKEEFSISKIRLLDWPGTSLHLDSFPLAPYVRLCLFFYSPFFLSPPPFATPLPFSLLCMTLLSPFALGLIAGTMSYLRASAFSPNGSTDLTQFLTKFHLASLQKLTRQS